MGFKYVPAEFAVLEIVLLTQQSQLRRMSEQQLVERLRVRHGVTSEEALGIVARAVMLGQIRRVEVHNVTMFERVRT